MIILYNCSFTIYLLTLLWRHNGRGSVSNHQPHDCFLNRLFRRRSKKTSKLRVTGLCAGNSPGTGEFPAQMTSNAENVSIWWRHHVSAWRHFYQSTFTVYHLLETVYNKDTNGLSTHRTLSMLTYCSLEALNAIHLMCNMAHMLTKAHLSQHDWCWCSGACLSPRHRQPSWCRWPVGTYQQLIEIMMQMLIIVILVHRPIVTSPLSILAYLLYKRRTWLMP